MAVVMVKNVPVRDFHLWSLNGISRSAQKISDFYGGWDCWENHPESTTGTTPWEHGNTRCGSNENGRERVYHLVSSPLGNMWATRILSVNQLADLSRHESHDWIIARIWVLAIPVIAYFRSKPQMQETNSWYVARKSNMLPSKIPTGSTGHFPATAMTIHRGTRIWRSPQQKCGKSPIPSHLEPSGAISQRP